MKRLVFLILLACLVQFSNAQFYNGLQMAFGKSRVQYKPFVWQSYRFPKYDTYFYVGGKELAQYTAIIADNRLKEFETMLGYSLEKRIIFLVYNNLSDFRQSNIGLISGDENYNIGGVTRIIDNKVFLYFDGDHRKFENQIKGAIAEVLINEMLYGSDLKSKVANNTLLTMPEWFIKGLISYMSDEWNTEIDGYVRDGILSGRYEKFNNLTGKDAIYAGHSIWYFISEKYGKKVIPNILYLTRVSKNSESGFLYVLGLPIKYLTFEWLAFFNSKYYNDEQKRTLLSKSNVKVKTKKNIVFDQFVTSPDGNYFAYTLNNSCKYKIFLYDKVNDKRIRILKKGPKIEQITDYSYPLIVWHPSGKLLTFITEEKGGIWLWFYDMETAELDKKEMFNVEKILSYSFNPKGNLLAMSVLKDGNTDIVVYNNLASTFEQITNDKADDKTPVFMPDGKSLVFSSNRTTDSLLTDSIIPRSNHNFNVFLFKQESEVLTRLTNDKNADFSSPFGISNMKYLMLSNSNGINNRYLAEYDSVISHIDTTEHYRYFTHLMPQTNYSRNINFLNFNNNSGIVNQISQNNRRFVLYEESVRTQSLPEISKTNYWNKLLKQAEVNDSLANVKLIKDTSKVAEIIQIEELKYNSTNIDFRNYIFEFEKNKIKGHFVQSDSIASPKQVKSEITQYFSKPKLYVTSFYTNYFVSQVDFGFLNNTYQTFTGGGVYFNPGFNIFFKIGTNDLLENYKITGGVRFAGNFDSNEYIFTLEDLKNRWDKEWIFHRLAMTNVYDNSIVKVHTHEIMHVRKYPFNQVFSFRGTLVGRFDRGTYLSTDITSLRKGFNDDYWAGLKAEIIYDDTKLVQLNIFNGTRFKIFAEMYRQMDKSQSDLWVIGADFRHYQKIHKNLISASRIAGSTSFGSKKLIYYMGSVDNWINLSPKVSTFDQSVAIDYSRNYAYQTLATNMRGFTQNIRNGNSFVVYNQELRWPFIKYFVTRPINSDILENMQLVTFFDYGSAWVGTSPYSEDNEYNTETINNGPVTVIIDKERAPFVYGYGFGLRTRMLGYFVRADWAWGVESATVLPRIFYLSLSLDF